MESRALEAEERIPQSFTKEEALENAIIATEIYMKAIKLASSASERERLKSKCMRVLARAEEIKQDENWNTRGKQTAQGASTIVLKIPISERPISSREEAIVLEGSKLHGLIFPPWTSEPAEQLFQRMGDGPYIDLSELKISRSQQNVFAGWRRPNEVLRKSRLSTGDPDVIVQPTMVAKCKIDLVQDATTDCSLVASLCAATARAGNDFEKILYTIFYPYDKTNWQPLISKNGMYIFRFQFNGCYRKVVIDDRLPDSKSTRTLHVVDRQNPGLLWPALLEKAYLKVRGGYDFPGSNSGTDLWILIGWIPEQVFLQSGETNPQELWHRIFKAYSFGDVIITLGTGRLSQKEEEGLGLAGEHDYAVLGMKDLDGQRQLLVKNPWCDGITWKGINTAASIDNREVQIQTESTGADATKTTDLPYGMFWITFGEVLNNFESLYLNWNPGLFRYRQDHHFSWTIERLASPTSFTHNPQYSIKSIQGGPVWVLLIRHFSTAERNILNGKTLGEATRSPLGFISLYVFDNDGRRVYLSDTAMIRGPFVDSPQTLLRLDIPPRKCYTVVVSQQALPLPKYSLTLSAFSRDPVTVSSASDPYPHCKTLAGAWTSRTAGGNASSSSYPSNPQFSLAVTSTSSVMLLLETTQSELPIHVKMVWAGGQRVSSVTAKDILGESGEYRRGCALAEISNVAAGLYTIICSTFVKGQIGNFTLRVESFVLCELRPLAGEAAGRLSLRPPPLLFRDGHERMLAPVTVSRLTRVSINARHSIDGIHLRAKSPLKIALERGQGPNKKMLASSGDGDFSDAPAGVMIADADISPETGGRDGVWLVVTRFGGTESAEKINVEIFSETLVEIGAWGHGDG